MKNRINRYQVEEDYEFHKWAQEIPPLHFKPEWDVRIIPPFGGAVARFKVEYNGKWISCYLDCYDELGYFGRPYWEIYPWEDDDVFRCPMEDTERLMKEITKMLEGEENA